MTNKPGLLSGRRSIRYPILAIAWVPSLVLMMIGLVVTGALAYQGSQTRSFNDRFAAASPRATALTTAMFAERRASQLLVANPQMRSTELADARTKVDAALQPLIDDIKPLASDYPDTYGELDEFLASMVTNLPAFRQRVDRREAGVIEVSVFYSAVGDEVANWLYRNAVAEPASASGVEQTISVTLLRATDELLDGDALAIAAFLDRNGLSEAQYALLAKRFGAARSRLFEVEPLLQKTERQDLGSLMDSSAWRAVMQAHALALNTRGPSSPELTGTTEAGGTAGGQNGRKAKPTSTKIGGLREGPAKTTEQLVGPKKADQPYTPQLPMDLEVWDASTSKVIRELIAINLHHSQYAAEISGSRGATQLRRSALVGAALLMLAIAVFLATTVASNRIVRRLRRLRSETLVLAHDRLPRIMERLRAGDPVDLRVELPPLRFGHDEIAQVADAFEEAQRMAVGAAAREAETRAGLRTVFLDIAHRSQAIVHRQLKVLDQAERAQEDPDQLALLFQLDHLSTRARRNAENLIILGGEQAGRQWRNPVPLIEVVRSAISEAEDYVRVGIGALPRLTLKGAAVADVIHLIAELVDNATSFSPPMSRVEVRGNLVGRGVVIEVEDQGLGIEPGQMEELNRMLHEPPDFQVMALADEPRLGLFVVGQLASRHGIRVTITPSPAYGGTRVVVLLPSTLIAGDPALGMPREAREAQPESTGSPGTPASGTVRALGLSTPVSGPPPMGGAPLNGSAPTPGPPVGGPRPSLDAVMAAPDFFPTAPVPTERPAASPPPPPAAVAGSDGPVAGPVMGPDDEVIRPVPPTGEPPGRAAGMFEAPLRDTGLFEPGPRTGLPFPASEPASGPTPLPRRTDRGRHGVPGSGSLPLDATRPQTLLPGADRADPFPGNVPGDPERAPVGDRAERVSARMTDGSTPAPTRPLLPSGRPQLPRRNRQTHLSPKLMDNPDDSLVDSVGTGYAPTADSTTIDIPDAEEARNRMSALQRGTLRGRATDPEA